MKDKKKEKAKKDPRPRAVVLSDELWLVLSRKATDAECSRSELAQQALWRYLEIEPLPEPIIIEVKRVKRHNLILSTSLWIQLGHVAIDQERTISSIVEQALRRNYTLM